MRDLDRRALDIAGEVIAHVTPADLDRPTPCAAWNLGELLRHLISENRAFADAAGTRARWPVEDTDLTRAYHDSAAAVTEAFAAPDLYDRQIEVGEFGAFPGRIAVGMHFIDFLLHGWDVAASIGVPYRPDPELAGSALAMAARWPDTPKTRGLGAPFGDRVPVPGDAPDFDRLLGLLGRSPSWVTPC
ncbi:TIGR03086 family metal-binding protein [Nonomuraea sp. NBC_01738]|uniref:TIGR03086 family metal-binding protein n=1 Tax=Nonomuraea sp. NBC_01738 TaxID=2976003 RepID=UPI002E155949|nr:TIGR03086 family metal-binding protein [Nonomuraea sp. NBC_01738]